MICGNGMGKNTVGENGQGALPCFGVLNQGCNEYDARVGKIVT